MWPYTDLAVEPGHGTMTQEFEKMKNMLEELRKKLDEVMSSNLTPGNNKKENPTPDSEELSHVRGEMEELKRRV